MLFPYLRVEHMCGKLIFLDVTFSTKVRWTVGLPACSEVEYSIGKVFYLRTVTVVLEPVFLVFTGKEVPQMLTIEGLIAVISLALTAFGLGYAIGRNTGTRE